MNLRDLTPRQIRQLALAVGSTTEGTMRGIASGHRRVSSKRAIEIEAAARKLGWDIRRESLNSGCASCDFAKACRRALNQEKAK